jgi:hypothetical protein
VPKGGGYQERDARFATLDPELAASYVNTMRRRSKENMAARADQIGAGLVHLTEAALRDKDRYA